MQEYTYISASFLSRILAASLTLFPTMAESIILGILLPSWRIPQNPIFKAESQVADLIVASGSHKRYDRNLFPHWIARHGYCIQLQ